MVPVPRSKLSSKLLRNKVSIVFGTSNDPWYWYVLAAQAQKSEHRPDSGHQQYGPSPPMSSRGTLPPTPPMQSDGGFDGRQSPSAASNSSYSGVSTTGYYFASSTASAINNVEPHAQRQHIPAMPQRRVSMPAAALAYQQSPYSTSQYTMSPSAQSMSSYYPSPMQATPPQAQVQGLYYQRTLPQVRLFIAIQESPLTETSAISTDNDNRTNNTHSIIWC